MQIRLLLYEDWGIVLMDKLKLKWRIFIFLIGFCALLVTILWLLQTVFLTDMYMYVRKLEIRRAMTLVEENIDSPKLQSILSELENTKEIIVRKTKEFSPPVGSMHANRKLRMQETVTQTKVFTLANGQSIELTFYAIITPVEATVSTLRLQLYVISGLVLFFAIIFAIVIARHISKPIEEINQSAKVLATGSYNIYFSSRGFLEIRELSETLNTASGELAKVDNLRRELMANISHDLRTPLALIYSYAEMMHDFPDEITPEQTQTIMDETKRLTSLVNDVLSISRLESGEIEMHPVIYNLTDSLHDTITRIGELVKKEGYNITFEYREDVFVSADDVKITQAFYNLLLNAIHYSTTDKNIVIRQSVSGGSVKIEVIDHGDGIALSDIPYIWDRYYKIDKKHKRTIIGTGLGLSIVKKIIDLHGGRYGVISEVGKGSTFWFEIAVQTSRCT